VLRHWRALYSAAVQAEVSLLLTGDLSLLASLASLKLARS
jgi:hypothetical protein